MTIFNYTVNYFDVGIAALILLTAIVGWKRGIAISVTNFIRCSFGFFLCFYLSSNFSQIVYENYVRQRCLDQINEKIVVSNNIDETINNLNSFVNGLPEFISNSLNIKNIDISSTALSESILDNIFEPLIMVLIKIVIFIAVFILFFGATGIILAVIRHHIRKKEEKRGGLSPLRTADKAFGMLFGVIKSFIIILALTSIIMYFANMDEAAINDTGFFKEAQNSVLLKYITEINPFNAITEGLI